MKDNIEGQRMIEFAKKLFPLNRSICGPDIRKSFDFFQNYHKEFKRISFKSGEKVFDWIIPNEWIINDGYIEHESGKRFAEFKKNNLHIVGYSIPIELNMDKKSLLKKIHTLEDQKDSIPYVTSYYSKDWGFCLDKKTLDKLPDGKYKVKIKSEFHKGTLDLIEAKIIGAKNKEIFFSSYLCHPSMANNELSGPVLINEILSYVKNQYPNPKYTYRFVLLPETIGSIAYLSRKKDELKRNMICGYNLSCVGDERNFSIIKSRYGDNLADRSLKSILVNKKNFKEYSFLDRGSDERQYCSPGIDLPVCTFCRSKFGEYPEYHNSSDNFKLVTSKGLQDSFEIFKTIIDSFEIGIYPNVSNLCEPQLGKRGLYPNISKHQKGVHPARKRMNILAYCDGKNTIFDISKILNLEVEEVLNEIKILKKNKLII